MTICAADLALRDLTSDRCPTPAADHLRNFSRLIGPVYVVELKDANVGFPAVNTGMRPKVFKDQEQSVLLLELGLGHRSRHVVGAVRLVVLAAIFGLTLSAVVGAYAASNVTERERVDRLRQAAPRASSEPTYLVSEERILSRSLEARVAGRLARTYLRRVDLDTVRLRPVELLARAEPMAVRAADIAQLDLCQDPWPLG